MNTMRTQVETVKKNVQDVPKRLDKIRTMKIIPYMRELVQ